MQIKKRATPPADYEPGWVSKREAMAILSKSDATVERLVTEHLITSKMVARPGRKPERIYNEASLLEIKKKLNQRKVHPTGENGHALARPKTDALAIIREFLDGTVKTQLQAQRVQIESATHERLRIERQSKLWLNIEDAVAYSGMGPSALLAAAADNRIAARRIGPHGSLVFRRASLDAFDG